MNGPVFVSTINGLETKIAKLAEAAAENIDHASTRLDPAEAQASAQIALAQIALATLLRGDRR